MMCEGCGAKNANFGTPTERKVVTEPEVIDLVSNSESDSESDFDESDDDREVGPSMRAFIAALTAANESDRKRRRR